MKYLWLFALLLVACSSTGQQATDTPPVMSCSLTGFMCQVVRTGNNDIGLQLTNLVGSDIATGSLRMDTKDCILASDTLSTGRFPGDAIAEEHFTCKDGVPRKFSGTLYLTYGLANTKTPQLVNGSVSIS